MPPAKKAPAKKPAPKPVRKLRVAYIGNFGPPHSTENHVARALESNGHAVARIQENAPAMWRDLLLDVGSTDLVLWTRTGWDYSRCGYTSQEDALESQRVFLRQMCDYNIPVVGYHLDLFVGLDREHLLDTEPFFRVNLLVTADGGHQEEFARRGINHHPALPGVSRDECEPGMFRDDYRSKLAFVGSHQGHYHAESRHRFDLVNWLKANFRRDCRFWPEEGRPAVRGADLRDLYASVDVAVGDSCMAPDLIGYISDRIPESIGRGAYLLHPDVAGATDGTQTYFGPAWTSSEHLGTWPANDWDALGAQIEWALSHPDARRAIAAEGKAFTLAHHTYEERMRRLVDLIEEQGLL